MSDWRRVGGGTICERSHYIDDPDDMVLGCSFCANADNIADTRWRPWRTAPTDGTVIEGRWEDGTEFVQWDIEHIGDWFAPLAGTYLSEGNCWRPAHPEWNEEPND